MHGILCQKKTWRSYSWFNPLLNRWNRCVFPPLGLAQAKIMRKIMTMKNMSQHGDSSDDLNCLKCSKMSSRKIPQDRPCPIQKGQRCILLVNITLRKHGKFDPAQWSIFFSIPHRVSQPEPMVREWQCPTCFQGLLTAVSGISGRNTWTTRKMDFKRFEERKGNISYRYHIHIYIYIYMYICLNIYKHNYIIILYRCLFENDVECVLLLVI